MFNRKNIWLTLIRIYARLNNRNKQENKMGPNITLTAFDGLVMFGPVLVLLTVFFVGNYFAQKS
jgi:hypothetical protein